MNNSFYCPRLLTSFFQNKPKSCFFVEYIKTVLIPESTILAEKNPVSITSDVYIISEN